MKENSSTHVPFHKKGWFQVSLLAAAIVSAIFQVTGPVPRDWLGVVPAKASVVLRAISRFLAAYGVWVAIMIVAFLGYWRRSVVFGKLRACWGGLRRAYVRCLAFVLGPVVVEILRSPSGSAVVMGQVLAGAALQIVDAKYGVSDKCVDVRELLSGMIVNGRLDVEVSNQMFGGDPAQGTPKFIRVEYSHWGSRLSRVVKEGERLVLP